MKYPEDFLNKVINGDCLEVMKQMPDKSVDLVLTDPPYGVTNNDWDNIIDLTELFRIAKGVVMTSQQPYTTTIISQFKNYFKYNLVWNKILSSGFLNANVAPLRQHEDVLIFGDLPYNPQKIKGDINHKRGLPKTYLNNNYGKFGTPSDEDLSGLKYPTSILTFSKPHPSIAIHPTQKPVELIEYLLKTYSNPNDLIFDPFLGSGTTALAARNLNRRFIGIEISPEYCAIAEQRLKQQVLNF